MRVPDQVLPGDLVIRPRRSDSKGFRRDDVWVVTRWPDTDNIIAGPYQSYGYALRQAQGRVRDPSEWIWRDHAKPSELEQLELVAGVVKGPGKTG